MNRTEKRCLIASAGGHLLLLVILLVGSAFLPDKPKRSDNLPALRVVPSVLVDSLLSGGGGNPNAPLNEGQQKLVAPPPPVPQPPKQITPPVPQPQPKQEAKKPAAPELPKKPLVKPAKEQPKEIAKNNLKSVPAPAKPVAKPDLGKVVVRDPAAKARAEAEAKAQAAAQERATALAIARKQLNNSIKNLNEGFSKGTVVEINGPGGLAYANYSQFVKTIYEDAWDPADDLMDDDSTAQVSVTIGKNGDVINARLVKRSGVAVLDKSVQRALDKVKFVAPFPEGAKEDQRTFNINFNLKAKRLSG